jgi:hypothetical protein
VRTFRGYIVLEQCNDTEFLLVPNIRQFMNICRNVNTRVTVLFDSGTVQIATLFREIHSFSGFLELPDMFVFQMA